MEESPMSKEVDNLEVTKSGNETATDAAAQKRIDNVAEEAAEKSSRTEQKYDKDHQIFSK
jgi:hypothetical protein